MVERSEAQRTLRKINGRSRVVDFKDVNDQLESLSNLTAVQDGEIASLSNEYYPWKAATNSKVATLQEFDVVFYNDLRNLDNKIDVVAINTTQNASNIASLSNTVAYDYITTSDLNDQLTTTYIQQHKKIITLA